MWRQSVNTVLIGGAAMWLTAGGTTAEPLAPRPAEGTAQPSTAPRDADQSAEPAAIKQLRGHGYAVTGSGLIGRELKFWWLQSPQGGAEIIVTTPEGFLIQGKVFDPDDGRLLLDTQTYPPIPPDRKSRLQQGFPPLVDPSSSQRQSIPAPRDHTAKPAAATVWDYLGQATTIEEGPSGAPLVYIFIDPFCPHCHRQWELLRDQVQRGALRVRWVPVAVLDTSQRRLDVVMGLLNTPRAETLTAWMRQRQVKPDESEAAKVALARNLALFEALKVPRVPAMIYKDKNGKLVRKAGVAPL